MAESFITPRFRLLPGIQDSGIGGEGSRADSPARDDLDAFLLAFLVSTAAYAAPLLIVGHPGSGKTMLSEVLAARLSWPTFFPIRIPLRHVGLDHDMQSWIEDTIRSATGETVRWPDVARATAGAIPVLILDGFDDLQASSGLHYPDFLLQVARFQEREEDQGRPLAVIVTSRQAMTRRFRVPQKTLIVRLEGFSTEQAAQWIDTWNHRFAAEIMARGGTPFSLARIPELTAFTEVPLLLMILAYSFTLDPDEAASETGSLAPFYERILVSFIRRELSAGTPGREPEDDAVEHTLLRLSLTAFAMANRGTHRIDEQSLTDDLTILDSEVTNTFRPVNSLRRPISPGHLVLNSFLFVESVDQITDGMPQATYEFLHSTFADYLIARLSVRLLLEMDLVARTPATVSRNIRDDLLFTLLSFECLIDRPPAVSFLGELLGAVPAESRERIASLLRRLQESAFDQRDSRLWEAYRPSSPNVIERAMTWSANLVLLTDVTTAPSSTAELLALPRGSRKPEITFLGRPMISLPAWLDLGGGPSAAADTDAEDSVPAAAPAHSEPDPHLQRYRDSIGLFDKWRVKILVVGSGGAGKTSLAKALSGRPFNQDEPVTKGLQRFGAAHPHPDRPDVRLGLVLWDLGGQDIYDSTHQLFMTADSIVVLVWQGRRDANSAALRPWLDIIADRAPLAPVVVVGTHADEFRPRVVEGPLRRQYSQIVEFLSVDNKSGTGVPELAAVLAREAVKLPSLTMSWPTEWEQAAERLRAEKGDSLTADRMWRIMMDAGVADQPSRLRLARTLHARGDLVFVEDDSRIFQRVVLTPEWINTAVYRLLDHARARETSGITNADLDEIWAGHPAEDRDLFLDLASEYDVGWRSAAHADGDDVFVVIQELAETPSDGVLDAWNETGRAAGGSGQDSPPQAGLRYRFDGTLPAGMPGRFFARTQMFRRVDLWRTGAVLEDGDNLVLIDVPASDSASIEVVVRGPEPGRTLAILDDIFQRSLGKGAQRRLFVDIPCPCRNGQTPTCAEGHRKDLILQYLHRGDSPVACPSTRTLIRPSRLLFGMEISADDGPGEVGALLRQLVDGQSGIRADQRRLLIGQEVIARGQATSCPATFVIVPKGHNIKFWNTHVQLKLYCGAPGSEHPLPEGVGVYDLTDPPEWLVKVGPYLDKLLKILKVAAPPATAIMGEAAEVLKGRCHDDLDLMDKWLKKAKELSVPGHALALPEAERGPSKVHQLDTEAEFRRVRALLIKQDPARTWGRLIAHTTREGTYYLCEEHFALVGGFAQQRDQD